MSDPPQNEGAPPSAAATVARDWPAVAARFAWPAAFLGAVALITVAVRKTPPAPAHEVQVTHAGPTVASDLRAVARLETSTMHVEKIVEVKDSQAVLGLLPASDGLLFVAVGEVRLGVDLSRLRDEDVRFDPATRTARVLLPQPEVLSSRFDEQRSHVYSRSTDMLAQRNEQLESIARRESIAAFEAAAKNPEIMTRAREQATSQITALSRALGVTKIEVDWRSPPAAETPH